MSLVFRRARVLSQWLDTAVRAWARMVGADCGRA